MCHAGVGGVLWVMVGCGGVCLGKVGWCDLIKRRYWGAPFR